MAFFNVSNQLLQIDTGAVRTYLYNASQSPVSYLKGIGENQVLGQRYIGVTAEGAANPSGAPAIFVLAQYNSTANPNPLAAPAPVYWVDQTYTTVTGVSSEALLGVTGVAGYMMVNTTDLSSLTATTLNGGLVLVQVAGYLKGASAPTTGAPDAPGVGNWIIGDAGNFLSGSVTVGTAPGYRSLGVQATAIASGLCDVLVQSDII